MQLAKSNTEEYEANFNSIKKLLDFVGDGVNSIESTCLTAYHQCKEYHTNEVNILFTDSAFGRVSLEDWKKAETELNKYIGINGLENFTVNTAMNCITLIFDQDKPLVENSIGYKLQK